MGKYWSISYWESIATRFESPKYTCCRRSVERVMKLQLPTNEGNFKHNTEVLRGGLVVPGRCGSDLIHHLLCEFCLKFCVKRHLWENVHKCNIRKFHGIDNPICETSDSSSSLFNDTSAPYGLYSIRPQMCSISYSRLIQGYERLNDFDYWLIACIYIYIILF